MTTEYARTVTADETLRKAIRDEDEIGVYCVLQDQSESLNINHVYVTNAKTPLIYASMVHNNANPFIISALLRHGADPNISSRPTGRTALHYVTTHKNYLSMEVLLRFKANVNCQDYYGRTPLFLLLNSINSDSNDDKEYLRCVQLLLNHHANINIQDNYGKSCIFHVIERCEPNKLDILQLLLLNSTKLDTNFFQLQQPYSEYNKDDTILHCAVRKMNLDIVSMILEYFRPNNLLLLIRNNNNETPYDLAKKYHQKSIMECLKITLQLQCNIFLRQKWMHIMN